jgi:exopolyphosphatase/guanosine-5'-triphosphate,3'-diphosphate pyrophosphatase
VKKQHSLIAAVDLGSNSFRLEVARVLGGQLFTLDSLKESVRLASGLDGHKNLDEASQIRGLECLRRFGERLRGIPPEAVRAVATNTLRVAKNAPQFLKQAQSLLGVPIEVIAGHEEARLIYAGVSHHLPRSGERRLVVDIGGGSTEFIIGTKNQPQRLESLYMGCVSHTRKFFGNDQITAHAFAQAELAAATELEILARGFGPRHWDHAIGSSGTARALMELLEQNGFGSQRITLKGLQFLRAELIRAGSMRRLNLPGLRPERAPVLPGGLSIMLSVFKALNVQEMTTTDSGLRDGVLCELLGRFRHRDIRLATVQEFARRYAADPQQAQRVKQLALRLYGQVASTQAWEQYSPYLEWACHLHEVGISIAHAAYHRHSAYIIDNADMPGFSRPEQAIIGGLCQGQRGRLAKVSNRIVNLDGWLMVFCLRLAVLIHRGRNLARTPRLALECDGKSLSLKVQKGWLQNHPLTLANLEQEARQWSALGLPLKVQEGA